MYFKKFAKTNYIIYKSSPCDYYTIETAYFLIKNSTLSHPAYVQQAAAAGVPNVRYPDRMELLSYLSGKSEKCTSLDASIPLEVPQTFSIKSSKILHDSTSGADQLKDLTNEPELLSLRLSSKKESVITTEQLSGHGGLNEIMSVDKIAQLKRKRLAHKQTAIQESTGVDDVTAKILDSRNPESAFLDSSEDLKFSYARKDEDSEFYCSENGSFVGRERTSRNRCSMLQSNIKNFTGVILVMNSVKEFQSNPKNHNPSTSTSTLTGTVSGSTVNRSSDTELSFRESEKNTKRSSHVSVYNRYEQEHFKKKEDTAGFKIDTFSSYHDLIADKKVPENNSSLVKKRENPSYSSNENAISSSTTVSNKTCTVSTSAPKSQKRESRTPIIVLPSASTSCIGLCNVMDFLQNYSFVSLDDKRKLASSTNGKTGQSTRENEVFVHRKRELVINGQLQLVNIPYRCVDNISLLKASDWNRVVAVFVHGPLWQFKGWPWLLSDGSPSQIFQKVSAFHIRYHDIPSDPNISKWDIEVLEINRTKRYMDRACSLRFWEVLDKFISKNKSFLRY